MRISIGFAPMNGEIRYEVKLDLSASGRPMWTGRFWDHSESPTRISSGVGPGNVVSAVLISRKLSSTKGGICGVPAISFESPVIQEPCMALRV
jgi:hypothetical protein